MKIVHITNCLRGGGIQNFLLSLLPEQVKQGHIVYLIVIEKYDYDYCQHLEDVMKAYGVRVIRLNKTRHDKGSLLRTIYKCRKTVDGLLPDIVNTHGQMSHTYGAVSVLGKRCKQVVTIHNAPERWPLDTKFLCGHKPIIFCSQAAYDMRLQDGKKMRAIENGISRDIVHSKDIVDLRKELGLKPTDKIIVSVGSLRPQKNYTFLKKIVDEIKDPSLHFCICGGNYGTGYISEDELNGYENIHCLGLRSDVSAIENGADLFLSCATFEGLPIAVLEAYFNGIPCVLSPIPQHKNIADVYKVYIPGSFDAAAFSKEIRNALSEKENHDNIYEKRKNAIAQYGISNACRKYIDFYTEVLNGK